MLGKCFFLFFSVHLFRLCVGKREILVVLEGNVDAAFCAVRRGFIRRGGDLGFYWGSVVGEEIPSGLGGRLCMFVPSHSQMLRFIFFAWSPCGLSFDALSVIAAGVVFSAGIRASVVADFFPMGSPSHGLPL
uniref:Secreted protein n=1 Tax=Setaria viridis TaxID=4556 RepID=A0A4U6U648_SETVI|nr:hypothetical protein SEVIR_6G119150v2 [Setaria viridis]